MQKNEQLQNYHDRLREVFETTGTLNSSDLYYCKILTEKHFDKESTCKHNLVRTTKNYKPAWKCVECGISQAKLSEEAHTQKIKNAKRGCIFFT